LFTLVATTVGAAVVTIGRITPTGGPLTIFWGDGTSTVVADGSIILQAHNYAGAGTWYITITPASRITQVALTDAQLSGLKSAQLKDSAMTYFVCYTMGNAEANVINSSDMVNWTALTRWQMFSMPGTHNIDTADMVTWTALTYWGLYLMPAGTYSIDSADMVGWTALEYWILYFMPAGTYSINTADMVGWTLLEQWWLQNMPTGTYTFAAACMANWIKAILIYAHSLLDGGVDLTQADVDAILLDAHNGLAARSAIAGTIRVAGTNAAPSGIFQAAAACPVDGATPGKEIAHELLNDGCATGGNVWATVTFTP